MRIAICDDMKNFRTTLRSNLEKYAEKNRLNFIFHEYSEGEELLADKYAFDLIFMDYMMNRMNGIDTVEELRKRNDQTTVIFVSAYKEVVFDTIKVNPFRFLVKPLSKTELFDSMDGFIDKYNREEYVFALDESKGQKVRLNESKIIYAEADNFYCTIRTYDNVYKFHGTLSRFEHSLKSDHFYRTHRSYLVNMSYIMIFSKSEVTLENGERVSLTIKNHAKFRKAYFKFLTRKSIDSK